MDSLLLMKPVGTPDELYRVTELTAQARLLTQLYELPLVIKALEGELEQRKAQMEKIQRSQEAGVLGKTSDRRSGNSPIEIEPGATLAETLKKHNERMSRSEGRA